VNSARKQWTSQQILPPVVIDHVATRAFIDAVVPLCRFPNPDVVAQLGGREVFGTIRANGGNARFDLGQTSSGAKVMYDDNTTPRLAFLWAHGCLMTAHPRFQEDDGKKRSHYVFAHVWEAAQDVNAYTNVANLVAVPKYTASLTDGNGPLASYFQYHAYSVYGWKPAMMPNPPIPVDYQAFLAHVVYLNSASTNAPRVLVKNQGNKSNDQRFRTLKSNGIFPWP
jgi:hypothetical protein